MAPGYKYGKLSSKKGYLNVLLWLEEKGILPDKDLSVGVIDEINFDMFEWLESKGITVIV